MSDHASRQRANRLASSSSPYLLQHAHNPVEWWPWGDEAIAEARLRDVPIFLSIGYSTCYWCHVMERECFENEAIATLMNGRFVCVKVDREERPDLDDLYMTATQITTGHGGWPMSVFLEPGGLRPFYCGTYFPPKPAHGRPSFPQILDGLAQAWKSQRAEVLAQAEAIAREVGDQLAAMPGPVALGARQVSDAIQALLAMFDRVEGGFGRAPKFPQPLYLEFLLDAREVAGDEATRASIDLAVTHTLDRMMVGGIMDQVGGGFHRYSVDAHWTVPHFEKMLYDNAMLAGVYARAARVYGQSQYARVARMTFAYVLRELTASDLAVSTATNGFASAQDAEVDGHEGLNYLWQPDEVRNAMADGLKEWLDVAISIYGLSGSANFRDPHHPDAPPAYVLRLEDRLDRLAAARSEKPDQLIERVDALNAMLLSARAARKQPRLDDKRITEWNAMMIASMASASADLNDASLWKHARDAAVFLVRELDRLDPASQARTLHRSWRDGNVSVPAFLADHAWLVLALVRLHEARSSRPDFADRTDEYQPLSVAFDVADRAIDLFTDADTGRWHDARGGRTDLFVRAVSTYDGATPSGVSVMLHALIALSKHEVESPSQPGRYMATALKLLVWMSGALAQRPLAMINATRAVLGLLAEGGASAHQLSRIGPSTEPAASKPGHEAVQVFASEERIAVGQESPAALRLRVVIAEGYHITAADPGDLDAADLRLMPLRVGLIPGSGSGVRVYADYPPGEPWGINGEQRVHSGTIEFDVVIERAGTWSGRPLLGVTFQTCSETECLMPSTIELDVAIDRTDPD
jgi:uncharacterized protein YyaL (SSP411 family)